jgi:capsular exopolysaccharide synthesis family protein
MKIIKENIENFSQFENKEKPFDPIKFILKYVKYWPYVAVSILISITVGFFINKTTPPTYQVSGKFYIKEDNGNLGILDLTGLTQSGGGSMNQRIANEGVFLKSRDVAQKAIDKLDFNVDYFKPGTFIDEELYKSSPIHVQVDWDHPQLLGGRILISWSDVNSFKISFPDKLYSKFIQGGGFEEFEINSDDNLKFKFGEFVELPYLKVKPTLVKNSPSGEILINLRTRESLISKYSSEDLQVFPLETLGSVLGVSLNSSHPEKGADYINALMEVYLEMELEEKNRMARNTVEFIDSQISGVSDTLSYFESNLENFRSANKTYNIASESNTVFQDLTQLEKELSQERFNKDYFENLRNYLVGENYDQILAPAGLGINDPVLNNLIESLITLQSDRNTLLSTQTEASPRVKEATRKINENKTSLFEVLRNLTTNSQYKISDLESRINRFERQFSKLPSTEQDLLKIQRGFDLNETIYTFLLQRRAEAAISMASNFASNKIVEYAEPNYDPIKVKQTAVYLIAFALGLIFPIGIIIVIAILDNRIKDTKELEDELHMPLIGKIPQNKTVSNLAVLHEPRSAIAESFRSLKTNISFVVPLEKQLTIAVSSTLSGEGKTFTAINLASIYSINQKKTILISCDMFKPNSFKDFDLKSKLGLSNYLSHQVESIPEVIQKTQHPFFDLIMPGSIPPNPSELLGSDRFVNLLEDLKKIYDVIVLDTPPVGLISQSFEVIKHVDLITFVLRYNFSEKTFIEELNSIKLKKGIQNIYAILNDVPAKELTYRGYNYGYYEESNTKKSSLKNPFNKGKVAI